MLRRLALVLVIGGCSREPSPEDYCRERDEAWARAYPEQAKAHPALAHNSSCPTVIRGEQSAEPEFWKKRVRCMREHIRSGQQGKAAIDAYIAMTTCESGGPKPIGQ